MGQTNQQTNKEHFLLSTPFFHSKIISLQSLTIIGQVNKHNCVNCVNLPIYQLSATSLSIFSKIFLEVDLTYFEPTCSTTHLENVNPFWATELFYFSCTLYYSTYYSIQVQRQKLYCSLFSVTTILI